MIKISLHIRRETERHETRVIGHPGYPYGDNDYIVENANGTRDTLTLNGYLNLTPGEQLASVTAVNCRENDRNGYYSYYRHKLYVPDFNYIEFNTRSIHYARTHLNQTMVVEGVVSDVGNNGRNAVIQDNTGGLHLWFSTAQDISTGDKIRVQVYPEYDYQGYIASHDRYTTLLSTREFDVDLTPVDTDIATLGQIDGLNPGPSNLQAKLVRLQNATITNKTIMSTTTGGFKLSIQQPGNQNATLWFLDSEDLEPKAELEAFYNSIAIGATITSVIGVNQWSLYSSEPEIVLRCRSLADIKIAEPRSIDLNVSPFGLSTVEFTASLNQDGSNPITEAYPGQQVYLHLSTLTPDNTGINYLKPSNSNYSKLMFHSIAADVPLTRVNSTCWSFIMPDNIFKSYFYAVFTPSPNFEAIVSDVWERKRSCPAQRRRGSVL